MLTSPNTPAHEFETAFSETLVDLADEQRDLVLRNAISIFYKTAPKCGIGAPAEIPKPQRRPALLQARRYVVDPPSPSIGSITDAMLMALTRDTSAFFTGRTNGETVGDWYDMRPHLLTLYTVAKCVNWLDPRETKPVAPPQCVEIGVRHGVSTLPLLMAMRETGGVLISLEIDPQWAADASDRVAAAGLSPWWQLQICSSDDYAVSCPAVLDLLWIDGAHEKEQVERDWQHYAPKVRRGGFILMHDYYIDFEANQLSDGVQAVVEAARSAGRHEVLILPWALGLVVMRVL